METISSNKVSLSAFDDKRFIKKTKDGIKIIAFGHYLVRDIAAFREVLADPDWGEAKVLASPTWDTLLREYGPTNFDDRSGPTGLCHNTELMTEESRIGSLSQQLNDSWSPPHPGFNQDEYTE